MPQFINITIVSFTKLTISTYVCQSLVDFLKRWDFCDQKLCPDNGLCSLSSLGQSVCKKKKTLEMRNINIQGRNPHLSFYSTKTSNKYICSCGTFRTIYKKIYL